MHAGAEEVEEGEFERCVGGERVIPDAKVVATQARGGGVGFEVFDKNSFGLSEFNQRVTVQALDGQPGLFTVSHQGRHYRMLPRETTTGAVRLEDPANGIVWLQIPAKSMLMNARRGQRMVDSCMHAEQRAAVAAATEAGQGIGIVAPATPAAAATLPVVVSTPATPTVAVSPPPALAPPAPAP